MNPSLNTFDFPNTSLPLLILCRLSVLSFVPVVALWKSLSQLLDVLRHDNSFKKFNRLLDVPYIALRVLAFSSFVILRENRKAVVRREKTGSL